MGRRRLLLTSGVVAFIVAMPLLVSAQCSDCDGDGVPFNLDCNDADATIRPGATEICDGLDNNCSGWIDDSPFCDGQCEILTQAGLQIVVSSDAATSDQPAAVWTGTGYGVVWRDQRDLNSEIYFALLDPNGAKLGPGDRRITMDVASSNSPEIAWSGSSFGVAWTDNRDLNSEIYFALLDPNGAKLTGDVRLTLDTGLSVHPTLSWNGAEFGVAWTDDRDGNREIYFTRVDRNGAEVGLDVRVTDDAAVSELPSIISSELGWYGVAWTDERDTNREIYFTRLNMTGATLGTELRVTDDAAISARPSLAWDGSGYGVAWVETRDGNREIYFARITGQGTKNGSDSRITDQGAESFTPDLSWTGVEYGVAWRDLRNLNGEIYFARIDSSGSKVGPDVRVTNDLGIASRNPMLAWSGNTHAVFWSDVETNLIRLSCDCTDGDGDGVSSCKDCDDISTSLYSAPSEARNLVVHTPAGSPVLTWDPPVYLGAGAITYDTLRSEGEDFTSVSTVCVESGGTDTTSPDVGHSSNWRAFYYLVRGENACPSGEGSLGRKRYGDLRTGLSCP